MLEDESILWGCIARRSHAPATPVSNHLLEKPVGQGGELAPALVKLEAVMGHGSVGRGLGRRVLAQGRGPIPPPLLWAVLHVEAPLPGAFNVFVVKLSAGESQHSSQ